MLITLVQPTAVPELELTRITTASLAPVLLILILVQKTAQTIQPVLPVFVQPVAAGQQTAQRTIVQMALP